MLWIAYERKDFWTEGGLCPAVRQTSTPSVAHFLFPSSNFLRIYLEREEPVIRKLKSGKYRLYSPKINPKTGKRRNLGTFKSLTAAKRHER